MGLDATVPDPTPAFATASTYWTGGAATTVYLTLLLADEDRPLTVLVDRTVKVFVPSVLVWIGAPFGTDVPFPIAPVHVTVPVPKQP